MIAAAVVLIPTVIMIHAAVFPFPIAIEEAFTIVVRAHPMGAGVWWARPISVVPSVFTAYRVPVAIHPRVVRARCNGPDANYSRWWWRSNANSN